ncbi:MAG: T9SS type A sorting domain-containing protein [Candidatus Kapaibacterium sp.]|jgi:hypothetical protein
MKKLILFVLLVLGVVNVARAQDTCKVFGQRNPHGVAMQISAPMYVVDSVNFHIMSVKTLPYNINATDTIFFNVCLMATDGKTHSTQVRYNTTHGMVSYNVSLKATTAGVSKELLTCGPALSTPFPNPAGGIVKFELSGELHGAVLSLFSSNGSLIENLPAIGAGTVEIPTASLPAGVYYARLTSGQRQISVQYFTVTR